MTATPQLLWEPSPELIERAAMTRFRHYVAESRGVALESYADLWAWSIHDIGDFWSAVWAFFGLDDVSGYDRVLGDATMPGAEWFPGASVNFAGYAMAQGGSDDTAIITVDELGRADNLTRAELRRQVAALARTLAGAGITEGDVVAGYLPNTAEAVIAFLATASLGATWASVGQDYAAAAVIDRFTQLAPKALIAADGYRFNGREHRRRDEIASIRAALSSVEHVIIIERIGGAQPDGHRWSDAVAGDIGFEPRPVGFDHPLWVLFSSGTTGLPKGLVHGHGGILIETLKQLGLHWNLDSSDRLLWYTSPSWVMWNIQLTALALGASIVCYEGAPTYPDASGLWRVVAEHGVTFFGASPGFLQASEDIDLHPARDFELSRLRAMGSTGSPLAPRLHQWARERVGDIPLWSLSGGTDIAGCFLSGSPTVAVWAGELSVRCLGVALEAWDEQGRAVYGQVGEMTISQPMPSMPVRLWNDPDGHRYADAYFSAFPGAWRQGDWITVTERGTVVIHGRSDSTLNRNGIRMGSADIYSAVEALPEIIESLVVGAEQPDGGYWMPLFVVLADGAVLDEELTRRINDAIRLKATPRHVPDQIIQVSGIPHTRTGKKLEIPVKRVLQGADYATVANPAAIDDPTALQAFVAIRTAHQGAP